jgi:hypothetical protein
MFCHEGRRFRDFHLLDHFGFAPRSNQPAAAIRAAVERVGLEMIDRLGRERGPQVLVVSRLSALLPLLATLGQRLLGLDDVARWRLGGCRGILSGGGMSGGTLQLGSGILTVGDTSSFTYNGGTIQLLSASLPAVSSGTLTLRLEADSGVATSGSNVTRKSTPAAPAT